MLSLLKPAIIKSIAPRKFLINGRFLLTSYRLNNLSDKNDKCCKPSMETDDCCKPSVEPWNVPSSPCCPSEPPVCCQSESERVHCEPGCPPVVCQHEEKHPKTAAASNSQKQYTLMADLAKKGYEIIDLIRKSNEYDLAKEQIKKALTLSMAYAKQYGTLLMKNISTQLEKVKAQKEAVATKMDNKIDSVKHASANKSQEDQSPSTSDSSEPKK